MTTERMVEEYRRYTLIAALQKGKYLGHARIDKALAFELEGASVKDAMKQLHDKVDGIYGKRIVPGAASPKVDAFTAAFKRVMNRINDGQYAMLKAHFRAPNRRLTPIELGEAAGYLKDTVGGVNWWYGFLGQWLFEEMTEDLDLMLYPDGKPYYTSVLATYIVDPDNPDGYMVWEMRPEVAAAVEALGLAN